MGTVAQTKGDNMIKNFCAECNRPSCLVGNRSACCECDACIKYRKEYEEKKKEKQDAAIDYLDKNGW
jgi:hypothetical protein